MSTAAGTVTALLYRHAVISQCNVMLSVNTRLHYPVLVAYDSPAGH